jgi:hypothetical protein
VVAANLRDFGPEWPLPLQPPALTRGAETLRPFSAESSEDDDDDDDDAGSRSPLDWAGIEGEWMRIVCFCDYRYVARILILSAFSNDHPFA